MLYIVIAALVGLNFLIPMPVSAHAFGQMYTLPLPLWLYLYGGGAALVISFVAVAFFAREGAHHAKFAELDLFKWPALRWLQDKWLIEGLRIISLVLLLLIVVAGFAGSQTPSINLAPNLVWIGLILGITYLSAIIGNIWVVINPLQAAAKWLDFPRSNHDQWQQRLAFWPAWAMYVVIIWLELFSNGWAIQPQAVAELTIVYVAVTLLGAWWLGTDNWFSQADFFSVFFGLISRIAPLVIEDGRLKLRVPFIGLLKPTKLHPSLVVFIIFMLSSTAFDGFRGTWVWSDIYIATLMPLEKVFGNFATVIIETIFLFVALAVFLALYIIAIYLMKVVTKDGRSILLLAEDFALTLVPIALAYNIAHYYTLLLTQGQMLIPLASDPLNMGWNLLGTVGYTANLSIVDARLVWNTEVVVIVLGHIAAVYLAHMVALKVFSKHKSAVMSQIPMLLLMVAYTITGLWILSQPMKPGG